MLRPPPEERYIDKHDVEQNTDFPHLDTAEQTYINSILTPAALKTLLASKHSFADLFTLSDQRFDDTRIFCMTPQGKINIGSKDPQFAVYYAVMQQRMRHNQQIISDGITDYNDLVNISVCFHWNQSGKVIGYTMYARLTDPENMGDAIVLAFYHTKLRRVVLLKIPGPEFRIAGIHFIGKHGVVIAFDKACGWCGRAAEDLKKCPCKGPRYCDGECQLKHWQTHKFDCQAKKK